LLDIWSLATFIFKKFVFSKSGVNRSVATLNVQSLVGVRKSNEVVTPSISKRG